MNTSGRASVLRIGPLIRVASADTAVTAVLAAAALGASLLLPVLVGRALDRLLTGDAVATSVAAVGGLLLLRAVAEAWGGLARVSATARVAAALRYRLLRQAFALGLGGLRRYPTGDLVSRLSGNAATGASVVTASVAAAMAVTSSFGGLVALSAIDWRLGAVFLLGAGPAVLLVRFLMRQVTGRYGEYLGHLGAIGARLGDALAGIRTIRAAGSTDQEVHRVLAPLPELTRSGRGTWTAQGAFAWQVELVLTAIRVAVLAVAGVGVAAGRLSPGGFVAAALYLTFALGLLEHVDTLVQLADARANAGRVFEVLADPPQTRGGVPDRPPPWAGSNRAGSLAFRRVSVSVDGQVLLDGVTLDLPAGAAVAVVGRSGAGKSTLALLAGRLLDPDGGAVFLDGVRVDTVDAAALRRDVAYAFDRPVLLGGTVGEAIAYGRPEATRAQTENAARVAQADDFVRRLPDGYDTPVAAAPFSGGELQRLGLARAVAQGGRVLVLDDATSSLDTVTEARVAAALADGLHGRTRLVVAHRATTAQRADLVAWLDRGRIRRVGPHRQLWEQEADYRAVFTVRERHGGTSGTCGE